MPYQITSSCIGCTACAKNCPVHAILGAPKEKHVINQKRCVDCGVCGKVCPKGAILDARGNVQTRVPRSEWEKPIILKEECSGCAMCVDICSFNSLAISKPTFKGDIKVFATLIQPNKCVGCGMCQEICPLDAITMEKGGKHDE